MKMKNKLTLVFILAMITILLFVNEENQAKYMVIGSIIYVGIEIFMMILGYMLVAIASKLLKKVPKKELDIENLEKFEKTQKQISKVLSFKFFLILTFVVGVFASQVNVISNGYSTESIYIALLGMSLFILVKLKIIKL